MPSGQYPFIDIAVHENVRDHYAAGDATVVLSRTLNDVLWVNGAGARLFGYSGIYDFMDSGLGQSTASFRQIEAAAGSVLDGEDGASQSFVMRTGSGFRRPLLPARMESIRLSDGSRVLLLTATVSEPSDTSVEKAASVIDGFEDMDTHAAVLDDAGNILQATGSFARLNMDDEARAQIVHDVQGDNDRLVKHPVRTALGYLPAAIARVADDVHLLIAVEMSIGNLDPAPSATKTRDEGGSIAPSTIPDPTPSVLDLNTATSAEEPASTGRAEDTQELPLDDQSEEEPGQQAEETAVPKSEELLRPDTPAAAATDFVFNPRRRPVRFVWKIDSDGIFREISPEFAESVGPNAAEIEGRKFVDVAQVFNLDPDHAITDLLRKRDTWSGKTVLWPVQGTDLSVPVDLAALPTYSRDREFDGFRGFGIVRSSDAQSDPECLGLALVNNPAPQDDQSVSDDIDGEKTEIEEIDSTVSDKPDDLSVGEQFADEAEEHRADTDLNNDEDAPEPEETPVLKISDSPGRRESDKVIRLEERRTKQRDGLTTAEKLAFHEIAQRLGQSTEDETDEAPPVFGKRSEVPGEAEIDDATSRDDNTASEEDANEDAAGKEDPSANPLTAEPAIHGTGEGETDPAEGSQPLTSTDEDAGHDVSEDTAPQLEEAQRAAIITPDILESLPSPIVVHDGESIFHMNEEFRLLTGYLSVSELNDAGGMTALLGDRDAIDRQDQTGHGSGLLTLHTRDEDAVQVRARLRSIGWQDGHALMLSLAVPEKSATDETPVSVIGPVSDGDTPLQEELELAASRVSALQVETDELRSILETATDGVVLIDDAGIIRSMNRSACALFDYDELESRGQPFAMLFAHESQKAVQDYLSGLTGNAVASVLNDGREVIGREASGGFLPLFMTIGHLSGSNGYCAVMRDITQWKRAEEELRSAKREAEIASSHKSEFLARVSHEIRTPLNAIIGFSDLMAEERFGPIGSPRYVEYAHDIGRSGKHVLDIVNDLLDISKIEAGEQELDFQAVSLNQALLDAVSILQPQANTNRVIIRTSLSSSVPEVVADERSIKQIAINILSNAIRFTQSGGQVVVSTSYEPSGNVILRIRDTGVGMTRTQLEQAMKPFKQVTGLPRERGDGTGLGLPLAKAMAEANRAQFAMNSQPGQGTLVEITFPSQRVLAE